MQFYSPQYIRWLWFLIPILVVLVFFLFRKRKRLERFLSPYAIKKLPSNHSRFKEIIQIILTILFLFFSIISLARPQWGEEKKKIEQKGVDIVFAIDTSLSMLAQDIKPSRFQKSQFMMSSFLKKLKGNRVGLVTFAGSSFLSSPLTLDLRAFKLFLDAVNVGFNPDPGSNLADAIKTAMKAFSDDDSKYQVIVLFSDGDDHATNTLEAATQAKEAGIRIYTVGVGTTKGEVIPLRDEKGRQMGVKKDNAGEVVITKLQPDALEQIARTTNGLYFKASGNEREIDEIYDDIVKQGKKEFKDQFIVQKEDHFQIFTAIGFICLLLMWVLGERKRSLT